MPKPNIKDSLKFLSILADILSVIFAISYIKANSLSEFIYDPIILILFCSFFLTALVFVIPHLNIKIQTPLRRWVTFTSIGLCATTVVSIWYIIVKNHTQKNDAVRTKIEKPETPDNGDPSNVIVLCDISASVKESKDFVAQNCQHIIRHYPPGSNIYFYFIKPNVFEKPFLQWFNPETTVTMSEEKELKKKFNQGDVFLRKILDSAFNHTENKTCILSSIENAFNEFGIINQEKHLRNQLIIFSDMLETCNDSPVGNIHMNTSTGQPLLLPKEAYQFVNYKGAPEWRSLRVNVRIISTGSFMSAKVGHSVELAWSIVFKNLGVQMAINEPIPFETSPKFSNCDSYDFLRNP